MDLTNADKSQVDLKKCEMQLLQVLLPQKSLLINQPLCFQILGHFWKRTVEKSQTNATSVIMSHTSVVEFMIIDVSAVYCSL